VGGLFVFFRSSDVILQNQCPEKEVEAIVIKEDESERMEVGGDRGLEDVSSDSDLVECLVRWFAF